MKYLKSIVLVYDFQKQIIVQIMILTLLDIASRGILEVVGDDAGGRKIILISACRFPSDRVNIIFELESC